MPTAETFNYVRDFVRRRAAIVIESGKEYLVESRLRPIAAQEGLASVDELVARLRERPDKSLEHRVVEAMTTNETSFFRDVHPFETLRASVVPELMQARAPIRTLRVWCAAASTGQEPYTIAMTLLHNFPELSTWNVQIVATDINASVLARARAGRYTQLEVNRGLPAQLLVKYFERSGADWELKPEIRKMVSYQELNLLDTWPLFTQQDIIFMRNVLIYFDVDTKRALLRRVRENLRSDGYLFLGGAETTTNIDDGFRSERKGTSVVFQPKSVVELQKVANASR